MSRLRLIQTYSRLNTNDLAKRIAKEVNKYIETGELDKLPDYLILGRHTGKLTIGNGFMYNGFDLMIPIIELCTLDRNGIVKANIDKIKNQVKNWRKQLMTATPNDFFMGVDDKYFNSAMFEDDTTFELRSKAYTAEINSFMQNGSTDVQAHDKALSDIDQMFGGGSGMHVIRMSDPDKDSDRPPFSEYVEWHKNGEFGALPPDYDALARPGEPGHYSEEEIDKYQRNFRE